MILVNALNEIKVQTWYMCILLFLLYFTFFLQDLNRQVVQTNSATISIPELEFEVPPNKGGITCYFIHTYSFKVNRETSLNPIPKKARWCHTAKQVDKKLYFSTLLWNTMYIRRSLKLKLLLVQMCIYYTQIYPGSSACISPDL